MTGVLGSMIPGGYEQVVFCHDRRTGLRSIIAIHDTTLGPALGGVRMWPYASEAAALEDCLRLARAMTYKAAAAGVNLGGGKSVVIADPARDKSEALLRAHGRFIQSLGGRYIPGIDVGTSTDDLRVIAVEAERVSCIEGDPAPLTALGVLHGIRACVEAIFGEPSLEGRRAVVQGAGHVGAALARMLTVEGAEVAVSDVRDDLARAVAAEIGGTVVAADAAVTSDCDILAPCALGAVVDDTTALLLRCRIIAGAANNVLLEPRHADVLAQRGILYAPDYVINAGGLIFIEEEMLGHTRERAEARVRGVGDAVRHVIARAREQGTSTAAAADRIAEERLAQLASVGPGWVRHAPH